MYLNTQQVVVVLHPDSCRRAVGINDKLTLLSGLERDAELLLTCHGAAPTKQLLLSGSIPGTRILKAAVGRGKGVQSTGVGHGINKCAGLPPALPLFVDTMKRGKGVSDLDQFVTKHVDLTEQYNSMSITHI